MGKWTEKTKRNAKIKKMITWWKRELASSERALAVDKANPRYESRYRDSGGVQVQETRIESIKATITALEKRLNKKK